MENPLTTFEVKELAYLWYKKLTDHAPVEELIDLASSDDDLYIEFPNCPINSVDGFRKWYKDVTNKFFDEQHVLHLLDISINGDHADVKIIVNWQAKTWDPPAAYSKWEGYNVHQEWVVKKDNKRNKAVIVRYIVGAFDPFKRISEVQ
jgi:hypothetical protein